MKVLITGGTGSLGQVLIDEFAKNKGYEITFTYYNNKKRAEEISEKYNVLSVYLDNVDKISNDFDIIINNVGIINSLELCENVDADKWNETLRVNLTMPFEIIKKSLANMKTKNWGRIINISSVYGLKAEEGLTPYVVSKHGLIGLTKSVAKEYGAYGITCNAICPGTIESDICNRLADCYTNNEMEKNDYFESLKEAIPARRLAKPIEVAKLAYFLTSDDAAYINGAALAIDGGYLA